MMAEIFLLWRAESVGKQRMGVTIVLGQFMSCMANIYVISLS